MADFLADSYLDAVLGPQLQALGLNARQRLIVSADVRRRLNSLLTHWGDLAFRRTALHCGVEEATFYDPQRAALDLRSLVFVGIRSSLIEDLGTSHAGRHAPLDGTRAPPHTAAACRGISAPPCSITSR